MLCTFFWLTLATIEMNCNFANKNRQKAILTGLPVFLGEGKAALAQATKLVADHCMT